jgi:hypothetical protein
LIWADKRKKSDGISGKASGKIKLSLEPVTVCDWGFLATTIPNFSTGLTETNEERNMQEQSSQNNDNSKAPTHQLWLIYCQLKHAETEPEAREQLISSARYQLGRVLNVLNRFQFELKSLDIQAVNSNCCDKESKIIA